MKKALITGINGQDGSYLAELLLEKGYEVSGVLKRNSVAETQTTRIEHIRDRLKLYYADMTDLSSLVYVLKETEPCEVYNLAAQSHVQISFAQPIYTTFATGVSTVNLLEAVRLIKPDTRIYQASSSEMFGNCVDDDGFQRETTRMVPVSPYGCAKVFSYHVVRNYRAAYGLFASNGILFNHESPRRGSNFVTSKVCKEAVRIKYGLVEKLELGNLDAVRDWGHAADYVRAMWMILQQDEPDDFVCATGVSHSVRDLVTHVFGRLGLDWEKFVHVSERYMRPEELHNLRGDSTKLRNATGWEPTYTFESMLDEMTDYWLDALRPR